MPAGDAVVNVDEKTADWMRRFNERIHATAPHYEIMSEFAHLKRQLLDIQIKLEDLRATRQSTLIVGGDMWAEFNRIKGGNK